MVAPNATALGRPSELVASRETAIIGANIDTSAQVGSRTEICAWVAMAGAIMIAEVSVVVFFPPTSWCEFDIAGNRSVFVDARMAILPNLFLPLISGALLILFVALRHRYMVRSKLHFWTTCYGFAAFASSWSSVLLTLWRCNQEYQTIKIWGSRIAAFAYVFASSLLLWLSVLKLRCLRTVRPSFARVGELSGLVTAVAITLFVLLEQTVNEQHAVSVDALQVCFFVVGTVASVILYGVLAMVLILSANSALNEASESDVDAESARHLQVSASWTRWTMIVTVLFGSTYFASCGFAVYRRRELSALVVTVNQWVYVLDQLTNLAASVFLSGILFCDGDQEYGLAILRDVASSVHRQNRRQIQEQLISAVGASAGSALTVSYLMDGVAPTDVLREAELRFRCITWEALAARSDIIIEGGPLHVVGPGGDDLYSLSEPCHLGDCDVFISHSWHDDSRQKWEALRSWCDAFVEAQGRNPRLWIDKVCICQTDIAADLRCLPVFIAGCKCLLIISGPTYPTRLWCAVEMLVHMAIHTSDATRSPPELLLLCDDEQRKDLQQAWTNFDVVQCNCFNREDKLRFLSVVGRYPGGSTGFNCFIRELAAGLWGGSEASTPTDDYDFDTRC